MNRKNLANALVNGKWAAFTTSSAVLACAALERREPIAPINAISHIAWGDEAFEKYEPSVKYSLAGLALNAAACISWALALELLFSRVARRDVPSALGCGAAVSLLAYVTDYHVVPPRLTPGFEKHLSSRSLLVVYIVLALSLAAGAFGQKK